jgi:cytochrome P450
MVVRYSPLRPHQPAGRRGHGARRGLVLLDNGAANHDPAAFNDPERFEVTRPAVAHLTFGHGAGYRLGTPLARIETLAGGLARLSVTW